MARARPAQLETNVADANGVFFAKRVWRAGKHRITRALRLAQSVVRAQAVAAIVSVAARVSRACAARGGAGTAAPYDSCQSVQSLENVLLLITHVFFSTTGAQR